MVLVEADMTKREQLDGVVGKLEGLKVDMWVVPLGTVDRADGADW